MNEDILFELRQIKKLLSLQKKVLSLDDFCSYTGISKNYAYRLTSTGKIKFYRPAGKMIFFDIENVVEFLKQNPVEAKKEVGKKINNYLLRSKIYP